MRREPVPPGAYCDHRQMRECCQGPSGKGCGHFSCPCGVTWDEGAEGAPWPVDRAQAEAREQEQAVKAARALLSRPKPEPGEDPNTDDDIPF